MNDYEIRYAWRANVHRETIPAIAEQLTAQDEAPTVWTVEHAEDTSWNPRLVGSQGERVYLNIDEHDKRLRVHSSYGERADGKGQWIPRDVSRDLIDESISVSAEKTPAQIARDIIRRFLPNYRKCLDAYKTQCAAHHAYVASTQVQARTVELIAGDRLRRDTYQGRRTDETEVSYSFDAHGISYGTMRVSSTWTRIELSGDADFARLFAAWLATLSPKTEEA